MYSSIPDEGSDGSGMLPRKSAKRAVSVVLLRQGPADDASKGIPYAADALGKLVHAMPGESACLSWHSARTAPVRAFTAVTAYLLPFGYPVTVAPSYTAYASWAFFGMLFSSISGVLSTQALLYAIGLGAGSIPIAAALNWVLKDGLGQVGGVLFAALINNRFDSDPKRWRFISALAQDAATLLEILTPLMPSLFLPIAVVANAGKNIAWLSASATRAGIHNSLAIKGNLADVTAKAGSQTVTGSTAGLLLGIALSPAIGSDPRDILLTFAVCSAAHLTCVFQSLRRVVLPTLSARRMALAVAPFYALALDGDDSRAGRGDGVPPAGGAMATAFAAERLPLAATAAGAASAPALPAAAASSSDFGAPPQLDDDAEAALVARARQRVLSPDAVGRIEDFAVGPFAAAGALLLRCGRALWSSCARADPAPGAVAAAAMLRDDAAATARFASAAALIDVGPPLRCGWDAASLFAYARASGARDSQYIVAVWRGTRAASAPLPLPASPARVHLFFLAGAQWRDCLVGYLHALFVARQLQLEGAIRAPLHDAQPAPSAAAASASGATQSPPPPSDIAAVASGAAFARVHGDVLVQDLELVGWWVGQPLLERDFTARLHVPDGAVGLAGDVAATTAPLPAPCQPLGAPAEERG